MIHPGALTYPSYIYIGAIKSVQITGRDGGSISATWKKLSNVFCQAGFKCN